MRFRLLFIQDSWITKQMSAGIHKLVKAHIRHVVKDSVVANHLTPNYSMGCKRITPSDEYLQTFNKDNVKLVTSKIEKITAKGIVTAEGHEHEVDTIIYATGFDLEKSAKPYKQIGLKGTLEEDYSTAPLAFLGITHPNHPNFYMLLGPGTGLGHNSIIFMIECQADYTCDAILKMLKVGGKSMSLKPEVLKNYNEYVERNMKGKVFADNSECSGWYRNAMGVNWTLWPLDLVTYWWKTKSCKLNDYFMQY